MITIPPKTQITSTIRPGSVYYFIDRNLTSAQPHYFIVINLDPLNDPCLLMAVASSQVKQVLRRNKHIPETVVQISPAVYTTFTYESIVNCNYIFSKSIGELTEKLSERNLRAHPVMDISIIKQLRTAAIASRQVSEEHKDMLRR